VFDDGSRDGTAAAARPWADQVISAPNGGIPTNKNRALFYFLVLQPVDQLILLEDDVLITSSNWLRRWSKAIRRHGHINATSPRWPRDRAGFHGRFLGGKGTPRRPERWSIVSGACSGCDTAVLRRHVGYVNPRFQGYGYEHIEWTRRFLRAGYGGAPLGNDRWRYLSLAGDLVFQESRSNRDAQAIARNGAVMAELQGVGDAVPRPWLDAAGRRAFLAPFARHWAVAAQA
jgi:glycosyltransferase involved in cell wall biosynthesis